MLKDFSDQYYKLLTEDFRSINLTRIIDREEFYNKQILDSVIPLEASALFKKEVMERKLLVDVGFGGGFPILPLAITCPNVQFIGIESKAKKVNVVGQIAKKLELNNVKLFHSRIEDVIVDIPVVCTFKAVGKVYDFLSKINAEKPITVFFYKGPNFFDLEKDQIIKAQKNWEIVEETSIDIPGTEKRFLIGFRLKKIVPYRTITNQNLVRLSEIIDT